jgi:hypothetical protein
MRDTQTTVTLSDTSPKAQEVYLQRIRQMTPAERVRLAVGFWETAYSLQRAAVIRDYPTADEAQVRFYIAASRFGLELAQAVYRRA